MQDHCKINATQNIISLRKDKGQNGAYASASVLPLSNRSVEKANQCTGQALPMYAQVDKTKNTSNKGGAAQVRVKDNEAFALKVTWSLLENHWDEIVITFVTLVYLFGCFILVLGSQKTHIESSGLFLESPENFSGPKSQLSNCNPLFWKAGLLTCF